MPQTTTHPTIVIKGFNLPPYLTIEKLAQNPVPDICKGVLKEFVLYIHKLT